MRRQRGVTLAEALVAITLAVVLGALVVKLITSGVGAHRKGTETRTAQAGARSVLGQLVSELRSSVAAPFPQQQARSPVLWPGVWGAQQEAAGSDPFYLRDESVDFNVDWDRSHNRVLYVRSGDTPAGGAPLDDYVLVELRVSHTQPNLLERRTYPLSGADSPVSLKAVTGADGSTLQEWVLEPSKLSDQPGEVLFDSGPDSRLAIRVSHRRFEPPGDPGRTRFPQIFDPGVFKVEVAVAIGASGSPLLGWPARGEWSTWRGEKTELRIPSVRSNL